MGNRTFALGYWVGCVRCVCVGEGEEHLPMCPSLALGVHLVSWELASPFRLGGEDWALGHVF